MLIGVGVILIRPDGAILLGRRRYPGEPECWCLPGGKVDPGETPETALIRELKEELGIDVEQSCLAPFTFVTHAYDAFHLLMLLYLCRKWKGTPQPLENQKLTWKRPNDMIALPMPPADKPLVAMLRDYL